ncbi:MAG TPA: hypothetical protein G4N99_06850 [Thermoflexia bacterium]|nr:hypothetical protein [Thermoflexia bacterium]
MTSRDELFELLTAYRNPRVFNQYRDVDPELGLPRGAEVRRRNLRRYLETFAGARYVLVGEAAGYAGCRFSGIPFTCEAQLIGPERLSWTPGKGLARSSMAETLWVERSAKIVWQPLSERMDCVLWNAFPWHPFGENGPLSNRAPGRDLDDGLESLRCLLSLFPSARPYAVGRVAERALASIGLQSPYIRHPSHGGKHKFIAGVARMRFYDLEKGENTV